MHRRQQRQRQRQHYRDRYEILRNILFIVANTQMEFKPFYFYYEISERGRRCLQLFDELEGDLKPNIDVGQGP